MTFPKSKLMKKLGIESGSEMGHLPCECSVLVSRGAKGASLVTLIHSLETTEQKKASEIFV